jgi:DnaJ like chaperone protein
VEDVKKSYRLLSKKYHPDRVSHLGDEFAKLASEKFQIINKAYEEIKKEKRF